MGMIFKGMMSMDKKNKILLLRVCYWIGAAVDMIAAVQMLLPDTWASFNGLRYHDPGPELSYALGAGASLMLGWTILLIWADRRPVERKGILLLTVFPVIFGLFLDNLLSFAAGASAAGPIIPVMALQLVLSLLFVLSYVNARGVNGE